MEFLFSNLAPVKTKYNSFDKEFYDLLGKSNELNIAVGYVTADSISELHKTLEMNKGKKLNLIIGMHYLDLFTRMEYNAASRLNEYLKDESMGSVRLVTPFRFHGKLYTYFMDGNPIAGIIGSNNLSSIVSQPNRIYEASCVFKDSKVILEMNHFISELSKRATRSLDELEINKFKNNNPLLENHEHVSKVPEAEVDRLLNSKTGEHYSIKLKDTPKSNLNVFFGKGRLQANGIIRPRHWYEVEIIVSKQVASLPGYPQSQTDSATFDVVTDDGWRFKCKVSGVNSKNFRSADDLQILGKWIKGRLEQSGSLNVGDLVTKETYDRYGNNSITLSKTKEQGVWLLEFRGKK